MVSLKRNAAVALLSWLIVLQVSAQSQREKTQTLFTINKKPVGTEEFIYLYRKNHQHKPEEFTKEKIEEYLSLFINYKLKVEEALNRGMDTTATFRKEYQTYRDELLKPYLPDATMIDSLVALTYQRLGEEIKASHILITVKPDASPEDTIRAYEKIRALRGRALDGEDFGALAALYSEEPGANISKGNLGFFTAMQMVFPFEQAAYRTRVGAVSEPVRTQFGYHIVKVLDRRPSRGEVEVSHIMIRTGDGEDDARAKNTIFDIYDKLRKGMSWDELCEQYSEDPNSKNKGGRLRPFGVGAMASVPQFQDMAFSLTEPGQISDPVETQFGWHILRLESRIPLPSFEDLKTALTQRVSRDERVRISKQALRERMRKEFGFSENTAVKEKILAAADSLFDRDSPIANMLGKEILFTMQAHTYPVKDFLGYVNSSPAPMTGTARQKIEQLFSQYIDAVQLRQIEEKVMRKTPDYKWLLKEYYEGILLFEIMEKEVWNRAMEDSAGQEKYFREHASAYKAGERMTGRVFSSSAQEDLEELKALIAAGDETHRTFIAEHSIRLDSGSFEKSDRTIFSRIEWQPGLYLVTSGTTTYLIDIAHILPPGPATFEEARASVISDYQTYLENAWITELKRKFGVKVEGKAKKRAFKLLVDK
jgi:peptidyl-prolyl cis-trans isomerase SurA